MGGWMIKVCLDCDDKMKNSALFQLVILWSVAILPIWHVILELDSIKQLKKFL